MAFWRVAVLLAASVVALKLCPGAGAVAVGQTDCNATVACSDTNAECGNNSKCACKPGFIENPVGTCSKANVTNTAATDVCTDDNYCITKHTHARCSAGTPKKCICVDGYTMLHEKCQAAPKSNCSVDADCVEDATCAGDPKKCQCKASFEAKDGLCVEPSSSVAWFASVWLIAVAVICSFQ